MEAKPTNIIDYGRQPRRRPWLILILLACFLATAGGLYTQRLPLQRWWHLVQLRHEVLAYNLPHPGTVLFDQKASDTAQTLLQSVTQVPPGLTVKDAMQGQLYPMQSVSPGHPWTVLLHERWTPSGKHRVVLVTANVMAAPKNAYYTLAVQLFDAGSFLHPSFTVLTTHAASGVRISGQIPGYSGILLSAAIVPYGSDFELLAGGPDPADPAAFLFDLHQGNNTITIKGSIADDDSISLSRSDGNRLPFKIESTTKPSN